MIEVRQTADYVKWFAKLQDTHAKARILARIRRVSLGNFGDMKPVGEGVSELRLTYGPGYRLYFKRAGDTMIILLCGGDKGSQKRDIAKAKQLAKEL